VGPIKCLSRNLDRHRDPRMLLQNQNQRVTMKVRSRADPGRRRGLGDYSSSEWARTSRLCECELVELASDRHPLTRQSEETQRIDTAAILDGKWYVLLDVYHEFVLIRVGHHA
jgi:hypothetical protein